MKQMFLFVVYRLVSVEVGVWKSVQSDRLGKDYTRDYLEHWDCEAKIHMHTHIMID